MFLVFWRFEIYAEFRSCFVYYYFFLKHVSDLYSSRFQFVKLYYQLLALTIWLAGRSAGFPPSQSSGWPVIQLIESMETMENMESMESMDSMNGNPWIQFYSKYYMDSMDLAIP